LAALLASNPALRLSFSLKLFAIDVYNDGVVKDPIEHRHGEHSVAGEGAILTAEAEIRG